MCNGSQDFQSLVESLLEKELNEFGVTPELFFEACATSTSNPVHKKLFDQILAVDNFIAFKKLMVKRNTELNNEAMGIQKSSGVMSEEEMIRQAEMESAAIAASLAEAQKATGAPEAAESAKPEPTPKGPGISDEKLLLAKAVEESQEFVVNILAL